MKPRTAAPFPPSSFLGFAYLRFPVDLERAFQRDCYAAYRQPLRYVCAFVALIYLSLFLRNYTFGTDTHFLAVDALPCLAFLVIFGLSFVRGFGDYWQPGFVLFTGAIIPFLMREHALGIRDAPTLPTLTAKLDDFFLSSIFTLLLVVSIVRLQMLWAALVQMLFFGMFLQAATTFLSAPLHDVWGTAQYLLVIQVVLTLNLVIQERLQRETFLANHLLAQERADERRKRERTEAMLGILGQAIGGIVHDLGNPLTSVQTGAETLRVVMGDRPLEAEMLDIVTDGARMLDYLRLSLLEQTRVLEGKPIPIERSPVSIRALVEAGSHYQSPRLRRGREVCALGDDLELCVDGRRLITVYMNLIGNALKYSDGDIQVTWRLEGNTLLSAVLDQGQWDQGQLNLSGSRRGISRSEAEQLFVAFGRLPAHAGMEGTGLGLLSAQKIVQAHGGEVYIEGYADGAPASSRFTTAQSQYPPQLTGAYRTAFVIACPVTV